MAEPMGGAGKSIPGGLRCHTGLELGNATDASECTRGASEQDLLYFFH